MNASDDNNVAKPAMPLTDERQQWRAYALAAVLTIATLCLRAALAPWMGDRPVLILFVIPIVLSAYVGGMGPGLVCAALVAMGTAYFVMPPLYSFVFERPVDFAQWLIMILVGVIVSIFGARLRHAPQSALGDASLRKYRSTELKVEGGFGMALACLGVVGVASYLSLARLNENTQWVTHTYQVSSDLDRLLAAATAAESAQRGYVISGNEAYLQPYRQAQQLIDTTLNTLRTETADNPAQQQRLEQLASVLVERLAACAAAIELRRTQGFAAAQAELLTDRGMRLHEQLRTLVGGMQRVEQDLLKARALRVQQNTSLTQAIIIGGVVLALGVIALALFAIRRDFSGRQRAESQLDRFFSLSLDFLCIAGADGYLKQVSPAVTDMLGWEVDEFLSRPFLDFVHPEDHAATLREVERQIIGGEKVLRFENRYRHKDGSWHVLSWRSMPQPGGLMYATARDVTEFKRTAQALRDAKQNLELRVTERTAELALANDKLQAQLARLALLSQITRAIGERQDIKSIFQVTIRTLEEQLPADFACLCLYDADMQSLTVASVGVRSATLALELALTEQSHVDIDRNGLSQCVSGSLIYEPDVGAVAFPFSQRLLRAGLRAMVAAPLLSESKVFGVLIVARLQPDSFSSGECEFLRQLSEHVALASHQAGLYGSLQAAYEDLRQTQQAVAQQERLRVLGQMASGIAHDINNAISPITLYTESLLEREPGLSERARNYLQTIQRAIGDVAETVTRMREFYRQREQQLSLAPVQLNALVKQVVELTRVRWADMPQQRGNMIQLQTELAADLPAVMGAENEIREALTNLIFNAVDAMPQGGTLTLRTSVSNDSGATDEVGQADRHVHVEVIDTGVGMDENTRRRCLELFFTTKGERGTGLGLAMVYGMVQRHSAEISIESALGRGTNMRLTFAVPSEQLWTAPAATEHVLSTGLRVLVIDDDPVLLKSLRDTLESDGCVVIAANGGQQGIEAFLMAVKQDAKFDIVITDLGMPFIDGRKVASAIKTASPVTPVVMLTGWGQRMATEGELPAHVDRVLSKPPRLRELRSTLAELTTKSAG